jgi:DNA-binding NarL/FixJ family response regulator
MHSLATVTEFAVRRSAAVSHHGRRRVRNFSEFSQVADEVWIAPARSAVLIALIDPKPLTRELLLKMLSTSLPGQVRLLGASSFEEFLQLSEAGPSLGWEADVNLLILYIRSAGVADNWVQEQLQLIRSERPEMSVIMISDRDDADDVIEALNYGIRGYIPTSIASEVAIAALTLIEAGGTYIPADVLRPGGIECEAEPAAAEFEAEPAATAAPQMPERLNLTSRELAVIDLLREGNPNKVIANRLSMRESTVKVHVRNILKKLRVSNRTHAATVANRLFARGIISVAADTKAIGR